MFDNALQFQAADHVNRPKLCRQHKNGVLYLYFRFACLSKIIKLLFPLRYPINCDTLRYGGMHTSIWIWSGHASASIISTFFCSHSFLSISPMSCLSFPYISFLLNFGAKTIWYWHLYVEWAVCFISFLSFFIFENPPCIFSNASPNTLLKIQGGFPLLKLFIFPRLNRGVISTPKGTKKLGVEKNSPPNF